ncbi:hypothetical protein PKHYL_35430 [Psychrobacter sp. KH172YL61]|nr:hypothetical protein PKHYL_35430 [Psychrobacter sp. KH172YL61]
MAVMMPNILQLPVAVLGVLRAGMTLVNVNPLYTSKELSHQLTDSDTKVLILLENFAKTYEDIGQDLVDHVVVASMGDMMSPLKGFIVNAVVRHVKKMVPAYHIKGSVKFKKAMNLFLLKAINVLTISASMMSLYFNIRAVRRGWRKVPC